MSEEEKIKYLYEYSKNVDFDYEKTSEMCEKLGLDRYILCIRKYLKTLNLEQKEIEEEIDKIVDKRNNSKNKAYRRLDKLNPVLLKHGKESYYLYESLEDMEIVGKYVIERCLEIGRRKAQESLSLEFGIGASQISKLIESYYNLIKSKDINEYENLKNKLQENANKNRKESIYDTNYNSKTNVILKKILESRKLSEVIEIMDSSEFDYNTLKNQVWNFSLYNNNPKVVDKELTKRLEAYRNYKNSQINKKRILEKEKNDEEKRKRYLEEGSIKIQEFLESNLTLNAYLKEKNISFDQIQKYVQILADENSELYNIYKQRTSENLKENYKDITDKIKQIVYYIKNGIEVNGEIIPFTILDFHLINVNSSKTILKLAEKVLNDYDFSILNNFFRKNKYGFEHDHSAKQEIINSINRVNVQKDKEGNLILETGEEVSLETKNNVINYLKTNKVPLNQLTYSIALKRYLSRLLEIKTLIK